MKKYFLIIISLLICFKLTAKEIEIISDKPGAGKKIIYHSWVQIEYTGSFENGEVFDTNIGKNRPLVVQIGMKEVIPGFEQGIIGTTKGTKRKIKIPAELAYGKKGGGDVIPPNTDLIFEFEIIDVLDPHEESQNIEIVFISHDGETAAILGNAFAEDLGFKNVSVLKGGILQWLKEDRKLVSHKKDN